MKITGAFVLLVLPLGLAGCGSSTLTPAAPTTSVPAGSSPTITAISPALGSISGATRITVFGTGLSKAATASFGGAPTTGFFDPRYVGSQLTFYTRASVAGTVDVVVTNPGGGSARLSAAYTFVSPEGFDFNGDFYGFPNNGQDIPIRFTVRNNALLSVSCDDEPAVARTFSPPVPLVNGEFSVTGDGITFSGRMVAASEASGIIKLGACDSSAWDASKQ